MKPPSPGLHFRRYQLASFTDHSTKTVIEHWSRQIGKSYTYAAWAVDRLLRYPGRLVTVLSNSRDNGAEFVAKVREVCERMGSIIDALEADSNADELDGRTSLSEDLKYANMRFEVRITVGGKTGRIKVLAANPRTARGFSGDLILDEFAFHEDSGAIWEAAEPIISSNPDFLCRILSTGNGRRNMFYQLISERRVLCRRVRRSDAWETGDLKIYSQVNGKEITPDAAREQSSDKRAYDQNYECAFEDENAALLTQELISAAERAEGVTIDRQDWTAASLARMERATARLEAGVDVGRTRDLTVVTVLANDGQTRRCVGMLEIENMRLPDQQRRLDVVCRLPAFAAMEIDMTGVGTGLFEYVQRDHGPRVRGVHFAATEPVTARIQAEGRKAPTARVTEIMATDMVAVFEERRIAIPSDGRLRDDLRKPEKVTSPGGRVSIAAARDARDHADRFWSLALAIRAGKRAGQPFAYQSADRLTEADVL